jgi:hypothetical protein
MTTSVDARWKTFVHVLAAEMSARGQDPNAVLAPDASRREMRALVSGQPGTGEYCSATVPAEMLEEESADTLANAFMARWMCGKDAAFGRNSSAR